MKLIVETKYEIGQRLFLETEYDGTKNFTPVEIIRAVSAVFMDTGDVNISYQVQDLTSKKYFKLNESAVITLEELLNRYINNRKEPKSTLETLLTDDLIF